MIDILETMYLVTAEYDPERERGIRWDDPTFAIEWPIGPTTLSEKDRSYPDFDPGWHLGGGSPD